MNEAINLLSIFQTTLGSSRDSCDDNGGKLWDRIEAAKQQAATVLPFCDELESEIMEVMNGERKAGKLSTEPMVRLIHFARTGTTTNARIGR